MLKLISTRTGQFAGREIKRVSFREPAGRQIYKPIGQAKANTVEYSKFV